MPLTRYQIRNEFNLADPDLYRASDKDDPEALLEGVAMAGLVGVLRQLGDLAEFAAEIFHDLHEEVMATAARGHGLTARIQQIEANVPLIEKNLLSQTDHTSFYYNRGIEWHPQMCTDQNLITQGDMPRFIRDSYEECRGPPQLFLLDKFDAGGAGACLKRYTDPSSFKAEPTASDAAKLEGQRDRRTRKIKRKGTHWRNGDTPEVLTTSHAKLHQLLIEERIGNDSKVPARHVKLKKRTLDGSKSSKSYMEKFLQSMSPEHSESHETEVGQPTLRLTYNHIDDSVREILDIQPVSAADDSLYFSPTDQETKLRPTAMYSYDFSKSRRSKGSTVSVEDGNSIGTASPLRVPVAEKELGVYGENRHINGITSLYSDDMASETENYMDAVANMESEAETDNEYNPKKELRYFSKHMGVGKPREQVLIVRDRLFDSQSVENSITSDDGSMSFMKVTSTSSLHGAPHNEEHGDREAESSLSMGACDALNVDCKHSFDYDETKKSTSNWYLNSNGKNVGSSATSFDSIGGDISFVKESSHLLQSSESGSSLRHFNLTSTEGIYDSECPQGDRSRLNGYDDTTPDDPCKDDNVYVIQTSIEGHGPKVSSEVSAHFSNDLSHDHVKRSSMLENGTSQNVYIDEFLSDDLADNEVESPRSATDTQLQAFDQGHRNRDSRSNLALPGDDHVGNYHAIDSKYVSARYSSEEVPDGSNHAMDSTQEMYGSFLAEMDATNLLEINAADDSRLIATQKELAVTKLLADGHDSEGHMNFEQSDSLEGQASDSLHADNVTNSTNLRVKVQNPELDHFPIHIDASSFPSSNHELLFYQVAVPVVSKPLCRQIFISNEVPEVDFSTQDNSLKLEGEEVIFPKDSTFGDLQTETNVNVKGAPPLPPLPPIQWIAGKPQDSFPDSDRESEEQIKASNGSLPSFGFGLKGSFHFTPVDDDIEQPLKATQTDENSTQTSSFYPGGFPLTDSTEQLNDTIDVHDQHRLLTSGNDSHIDNARTYLQNGQSEPLSFATEIPQPSSGTYLPASMTDIDTSTTEAVQASDNAQFSVAMIGEMTTHAKENIQPRPAAHAVSSAGETAEPSTSLESLQPTLGDRIMNVSDASEVPATSADQSLEESTSYSRTEHAARSVGEKIINQLEVLGLQNENVEDHMQKMKSSERQAKWSLALLNYEDEKLAQKPAVKPPRPKNPLIDSVDALDRSKLKKVTPRKQPEKPNVDERGSLLEQIRTKSFNLKPAPAPVPKPSIQAPTMNLKVAAILEKANKIRRATAGSDEDEDEWSDD